ncbi:hypothetical protein OHA40_16850 [Nocardia sp. NBC_00508]|uniref:hypothetical protein n=1 Tax=Nocardia sp. NBC_00508 TaxID=2975992 RepID=UPI002E7FEAEC|nr:hypothetical protein [Nocardia sp. NBC_00508]WUD69636.1 hypothetical protein OHA40_16850 [Nocardia sp. NBC_00508]
MSEKYYPRHTTGADDDVLVTMAVHHASFEVHYFAEKVMVNLGGVGCGMHLTVQQAQAFRALLDAGIADALADQESATYRVDLVKAVA